MAKKEVFPFPSEYAKLKKTHLEILLEAEQLLGTLGVNGLELKTISTKLDVSPSLIHHYYQNSEELIFDTVLFSYNRVVNSIHEKFGDSKDPETAARIWIKEMLDWETGYPGIGVILEFPRQVLRTGAKSADDGEKMLKHFMKQMSLIGAKNVAFLASSVRSLQKNTDFQKLTPAKVATLIATDQKFAMFTSMLGFATIGGGLWIAGRKPQDKKSSIWMTLGFDPKKQTQVTIDNFIKMIKSS